MTKDEAMKLALEAFEVATTPFARDRQEVFRAKAALREALAEQPAQQEPVGTEYIDIPVAYQYCYPDGAWRCSFGDEINGSKPIASRALYARKDGK